MGWSNYGGSLYFFAPDDRSIGRAMNNLDKIVSDRDVLNGNTIADRIVGGSINSGFIESSILQNQRLSMANSELRMTYQQKAIEDAIAIIQCKLDNYNNSKERCDNKIGYLDVYTMFKDLNEGLSHLNEGVFKLGEIYESNKLLYYHNDVNNFANEKYTKCLNIIVFKLEILGDEIKCETLDNGGLLNKTNKFKIIDVVNFKRDLSNPNISIINKNEKMIVYNDGSVIKVDFDKDKEEIFSTNYYNKSKRVVNDFKAKNKLVYNEFIAKYYDDEKCFCEIDKDDNITKVFSNRSKTPNDNNYQINKKFFKQGLKYSNGEYKFKYNNGNILVNDFTLTINKIKEYNIDEVYTEYFNDTPNFSFVVSGNSKCQNKLTLINNNKIIINDLNKTTSDGVFVKYHKNEVGIYYIENFDLNGNSVKIEKKIDFKDSYYNNLLKICSYNTVAKLYKIETTLKNSLADMFIEQIV